MAPRKKKYIPPPFEVGQVWLPYKSSHPVRIIERMVRLPRGPVVAIVIERHCRVCWTQKDLCSYRCFKNPDGSIHEGWTGPSEIRKLWYHEYAKQ